MILRVEDPVDSLVVRIVRVHLDVGHTLEPARIRIQRSRFDLRSEVDGIEHPHINQRGPFQLLDRAGQREALNLRVAERIGIDALELRRMLIIILERDYLHAGKVECAISHLLNASGNPDAFDVRPRECLSTDGGHTVRDRDVRRLTPVLSEDTVRNHEIIR